MCEKIFLLLEVKMNPPVEQKVFIVRIFYATMWFKKVREEFSVKYCIVRFY